MLRMLAEAGEEDLTTVVNTLLRSATNPSDPRHLLVLAASLENLRAQQLIGYALYARDWSDLIGDEAAEYLPVHHCLVWNDSLSEWLWNEDDCGKDRLIVVLQQKGREALTSLPQ